MRKVIFPSGPKRIPYLPPHWALGFGTRMQILLLAQGFAGLEGSPGWICRQVSRGNDVGS